MVAGLLRRTVDAHVSDSVQAVLCGLEVVHDQLCGPHPAHVVDRRRKRFVVEHVSVVAYLVPAGEVSPGATQRETTHDIRRALSGLNSQPLEPHLGDVVEAGREIGENRELVDCWQRNLHAVYAHRELDGLPARSRAELGPEIPDDCRGDTLAEFYRLDPLSVVAEIHPRCDHHDVGAWGQVVVWKLEIVGVTCDVGAENRIRNVVVGNDSPPVTAGVTLTAVGVVEDLTQGSANQAMWMCLVGLAPGSHQDGATSTEGIVDALAETVGPATEFPVPWLPDVSDELCKVGHFAGCRDLVAAKRPT